MDAFLYFLVRWLQVSNASTCLPRQSVPANAYLICPKCCSGAVAVDFTRITERGQLTDVVPLIALHKETPLDRVSTDTIASTAGDTHPHADTTMPWI